jgi:hypothetical protein
LSRREAEDFRLILHAVADRGIVLHFPGAGIVVTICADRVRLVVVIGRADADGEVAVETERLWQAYRRRNRLPEKLRVCEDTRAVRIQPGEHGVPAQPSQRELAIRTIEAHTACGKAIDVRRFHERMPVCADVGVQIVGDDEEDVRLFRRGIGE